MLLSKPAGAGGYSCCPFASRNRAGWAQVPRKVVAKTKPTLRGRVLWATGSLRTRQALGSKGKHERPGFGGFASCVEERVYRNVTAAPGQKHAAAGWAGGLCVPWKRAAVGDRESVVQRESDRQAHLPVGDVVVFNGASRVGHTDHRMLRTVFEARVTARLTASSIPVAEDPTRSMVLYMWLLILSSVGGRARPSGLGPRDAHLGRLRLDCQDDQGSS